MSAAPGLLIAASRSGSGKTVVTLGLMRAFATRGLRVAGLKNGPDYIDPAFHAAATGRPSLNIDTWAMSRDLAASLGASAAADADLVVCEGSMGLFDGVPAAPGQSGSSADTAALLGFPVVLVHDCSGQSQSAAALLAGCRAYDPRLTIAGVILNRIGSPRHRRLVAEAVEATGMAVLGAIPRHDGLGLPERHLGLVQAGETPDLDRKLEAFAEVLAREVDLGAVIAAAARGPALLPRPPPPLRPPGQRIAGARDAAFSFLYPHVLEGWRQAGADIAFFSPLADETPPWDADCCWLPGGYPELHGGRLAAAERFKQELRRFAHTRPVHGECGGYMVLGRGLTDAAGDTHEMLGLLSVTTSFAKRRMTLGYRAATLVADGCLGSAGAQIRGHEFHYATVTDPGTDLAFASVRDAYGSDPAPAGGRRGNVTGSFFHAISGAPSGSAVNLS